MGGACVCLVRTVSVCTFLFSYGTVVGEVVHTHTHINTCTLITQQKHACAVMHNTLCKNTHTHNTTDMHMHSCIIHIAKTHTHTHSNRHNDVHSCIIRIAKHPHMYTHTHTCPHTFMHAHTCKNVHKI